jgi:hypothetical protein
VSSCARILTIGAFFVSCLDAQSSAPYVSQVLSWSSVFNQPVYGNGGTPTTVPHAVASVFGYSAPLPLSPNGSTSNTLASSNFTAATSFVQVNNAINSSIATALGVIPMASPAVGVVPQKDPATGVNDVPGTTTLGMVFTERAETIGKGKLYIGVTHQDFHFTSLNGQSLNGLQVLWPGQWQSGVYTNSGSFVTTSPATFRIGMDVRLSQNVAFITYGISDRVDVSVGLPVVHAAVAARTYDGILYSGDGNGDDSTSNPNSWSAGTFTPGGLVSPTTNFTLPNIGQSSLGKTGFGDTLIRLKARVLKNNRVVVAVGGDLRLPTGDAQNYLGTGAISVRPFAALSLKVLPTHGILFAPHFYAGWQFSGRSVLGGQLQASCRQPDGTLDPCGQQIPIPQGDYYATPFTTTKDFLPDVFSWAVGSEVAFGRRTTVTFDILGSDIGWIHGAPTLVNGSSSGISPITNQLTSATGLTNFDAAGNPLPPTSYSQFSGAFGFKRRVIGNLVFTFNELVRFDSNGLTARLSPLYGFGYTF